MALNGMRLPVKNIHHLKRQIKWHVVTDFVVHAAAVIAVVAVLVAAAGCSVAFLAIDSDVELVLGANNEKIPTQQESLSPCH